MACIAQAARDWNHAARRCGWTLSCQSECL